MNKSLVLIIIIIALIGGFWLFNKSEAPEETTPLTISLLEQNSSGESGTATLVEVNGKVVVTLNLTGAPEFAQPAHIHTDSCENIGSIQHPLASPISGASETTVDVTMAELMSGLPLAINVHKSPEEAGIYVACGNL